jgi:hypothetical protein
MREEGGEEGEERMEGHVALQNGAKQENEKKGRKSPNIAKRRKKH